jgi:hypothetical protein
MALQGSIAAAQASTATTATKNVYESEDAIPSAAAYLAALARRADGNLDEAMLGYKPRPRTSTMSSREHSRMRGRGDAALHHGRRADGHDRMRRG